MPLVNDIVLGRVLRALRRKRGWRQADLAARCGLSQTEISALERGAVSRARISTVRAAFAALEARIDVTASWRGAEMERLLDEDHAGLVRLTAQRLEAAGWSVALEVTYNEFGDRGSMDVLGLDPGRRACLVVEVKTAIASTEAIGRKLDEKMRVAPVVVGRRWGWRPTSVGSVLVLPETMRLRRQVERDGALRRMLPASRAEVRAWLRQPQGAVAGILFLSDSSGRAARGTPRVRIRPAPGAANGSVGAGRPRSGSEMAPVPSSSTGRAG